MIINARPHINGNTAGDFASAALALSDALSDVHEALSRIRAEILNSRNYQHLPEIENWNARDADIGVAAEAMTAYCKLRHYEASLLEIAVEYQ